ncbi:hypothetical protein P4H21_19890 [Bacillus cereus]|uniref:hypothetical protein n=1 Tax=Bacillus cereus TaxID=1396 RepID=UPI002AC2505E|nr:hypothetical protein [Bacillus cereus]MDZ4621208.1 hypothetical protein [Bacillus cereus]MEB8703003.1 hypothetical protein [Bacillus cereus]
MEKTSSKLDNAAIEGIIEALKDENECLRIEIDYLKKLKALVQKEKKLQSFLNEKAHRL